MQTALGALGGLVSGLGMGTRATAISLPTAAENFGKNKKSAVAKRGETVYNQGMTEGSVSDGEREEFGSGAGDRGVGAGALPELEESESQYGGSSGIRADIDRAIELGRPEINPERALDKDLRKDDFVSTKTGTITETVYGRKPKGRLYAA